MENLFFTFIIIVGIIVFAYKATKSGMIDDAINFVKYEIFKMKR